MPAASTKSRQVCVNTSHELADAIEALAAAEMRSISSMAMVLIAEALQARGAL